MDTKLLIALTVITMTLFSSWIAIQSSPINKSKAASEFMDGDIIFQSSMSGQSAAIQVATNSKYSHCGIVFLEEGKPFVLEAVQPVKLTPLKKWITHGDDHHFVVKRLVDREGELSKSETDKMKDLGDAWLGKNYDITFEWDDSRIYCSELVWKLYERAAGIELCELQELRDFDLSSTIVSRIVEERYGSDIPWDEKVVSPGALFDCPLLEIVFEK